MFTGIITDIGELAARDGGRFTIRCSYAAESIAIGASIACDGACLTADRGRAEPGGGSTLHGRRLQRDAGQDHARRLAARAAHQPGARAQGRRRAGRAHRGRACRRRRPHRRHPRPTANRAASRWRRRPSLPATSPPRARWRSTGSRSPSTRWIGNRFGINIIPHTLTHTTLGRQKAGRPGQPGGRPVRALRGAAEPWSCRTGEGRACKTGVYAEGKGFLSPIDEIIEDLRNGRMIILVDAEDRENEGDLVIPAQMATPDAINFMAKHGRGLICLSLTRQRADQLRLEYMARQNEARNRTAFTVSIEAREGVATGISAHDRARTIATAIDPTKDLNDIVSPGHVFPLIAREGGVLVRAGHTEASVDLARLAGLYPAGVICEIMNDDGTMARMPDLVAFAQRHGLKIGTIEDLIGYRLQHDRIVKQVAKTERRQRATAATSTCTSTRPRWSRSSTWPSSRATSARPARCWCACMPSTRIADMLGIGAEGAKRLADREVHAGHRRGGPRRDRADPRPAAQVGVGLDRPATPSAERPGKADGRAPPGRDRRRLADPARPGRQPTWCCCRTRRPRATSASRRSGCASSASARSAERHGRPGTAIG